ncbi:MAG: MBL fold metallo-hydrolase, partial [Candidatus Eisenbacteria bacterium]
MTTPLSIAFHGAARTVTGSRHLMTFGKFSWLFDCGIYQGRREEADQINRTFRFDPAGLDAVIISHAHLDHVGNLPTLVNQGFRGPIHMTEATADLTRVMLEDSASLMEMDFERANRHRREGPARKPLYNIEDVNRVLERLVTHPYHQAWSPFEGVSVVYHDAGHIIGAAVTTFEFTQDGQTRRVLMGGDLGRPARPILRDPEVPPGSEVLVLESTYGDRLHTEEKETERELVEIVNKTIQRGGRVVVPSFAVGRTQELVAVLHNVIERGL